MFNREKCYYCGSKSDLKECKPCGSIFLCSEHRKLSYIPMRILSALKESSSNNDIYKI